MIKLITQSILQKLVWIVVMRRALSARDDRRSRNWRSPARPTAASSSATANWSARRCSPSSSPAPSISGRGPRPPPMAPARRGSRHPAAAISGPRARSSRPTCATTPRRCARRTSFPPTRRCRRTWSMPRPAASIRISVPSGPLPGRPGRRGAGLRRGQSAGAGGTVCRVAAVGFPRGTESQRAFA